MFEGLAQDTKDPSHAPDLGRLVWIAIFLILGRWCFEWAWRFYGARLVREQKAGELIAFSLHGVCAYALCLLFLLLAVLVVNSRVPSGGALRWRSLLLGVWRWTRAAEAPLAAGLAFLAASPFLFEDHGGREALELMAVHSSRSGAVLVALLFVIVMPFFVEAVFRGILFPSCAAWTGPFTASVAVSLLYSYIWPLPAAVPSFILGVASSVVYHRSKSVLLSFATNLSFTVLTSAFILWLSLR